MPQEDVFPGLGHDHQHCKADAVARAEALCAERGLRFTRIRKRVLELVWDGHEPMGAYAILERLKEEGFRAAPPTVYRALDFLMEQGLAHRIEMLNAYVGCAHPGKEHAGQFLICTSCGQLAEIEDTAIGAVIQKKARLRGFEVSRAVVEIEGLCPNCQGD